LSGKNVLTIIGSRLLAIYVEITLIRLTWKTSMQLRAFLYHVSTSCTVEQCNVWSSILQCTSTAMTSVT